MMETMNTPEKRTYSSTTMNTKRYFIYAAALVLMAACQAEKETYIEETAPLTTEQKVVAPAITAIQESGNDTKSVLDVDGEGVGTIYWTPADEINVFYGTTSTHYVSQNAVNATTAVFTTTDVIGSTESASENIWGLYPYNSSATCTGSAVTTTLPATQYGVPGTFDEDLFITLAHNTSTALKFYNVCGGIKFSLSRDDIASITFKGNNNEDIAGDISLNFVDGLPNVSVTSGQKVITLTPKTGSTFSAGEYYYLVSLPVSLTNGFTMIFRTIGGYVGTFTYTDKAITIRRSIFSKKANIDSYVPSFTVPSNQIIYTTTDGNPISPAAYNSIVSNEYSNGVGIITYENDLTGIGGFQNCTTLASVAMPNTVTSIGIRAFFQCTNLTSVTMSTSLLHINQECFCGCESLSEITIPDNDGWIYSNAFNGCSSLKEIIVPDGVRIASYSFANCTSLNYVRFPNELTTLPEGILKGCTSLSSVSIPSGVTSIGQYAFNGCTGLGSIDIPNGVTSIGGSAFNKCTGLTSIVIPSKVTSLGLGAVGRCTNLESITVLPTTPPTAGGLMFMDSTCPIYVPAASVDSYKAADEWSSYASRIQAIP